jgi:hypothetical protein
VPADYQLTGWLNGHRVRMSDCFEMSDLEAQIWSERLHELSHREESDDVEMDWPHIRKLIGYHCNFRNQGGTPMYERVRGKRGSRELRRSGASEACICCGLPDIPGSLTFAHIHSHDAQLSPRKDPTRVFCLCWTHHHGFYDQGYISTLKLLELERIWIEEPRRRPKPHPRDVEVAQKVTARKLRRNCIWNQKKPERSATFNPNARGEWDHPDVVFAKQLMLLER